MKLKPIALAAAIVSAEYRAARVAISRNPLTVEITNEDFVEVKAGVSIESLIPEDIKGQPLVCMIDGQFIDRSEWKSAVRPGEVVIFQVLAQGGGNGGSNPMRILLTIAVIYASVQFGPQVGAALGFAKGSAAAMAAGQFAIQTLGSLAINALVPLPKQQDYVGVSASPTYSVSLQGNQARINQPIAVGYGEQFQYPDFASQPYVEYINNEQYYHALLEVGKGQYNVLRVQIENTDINAFQDVTYNILGPGQDYGFLADGRTFHKISPSSVVVVDPLVNSSVVTSREVAGQAMETLSWIGPFAVCHAGYRVDEISVDVAFPRGLGVVDGNTGAVSNNTQSYIVQAREINDDDVAIGGWVDIGNESVTRGTPTPQAVTSKYTVTEGRYQVRIRRTAALDTNSRVLNEMSWVGMRGRLTVPGITDTTSTFVAVKIRASKQLSGGSQNRIGVLWQRHIPVWNGTSWIPQYTRNPAWAIADILRNTEYGRGLADSRLDLTSFLAMAAVWDSRQDRFDYIFDSKTTILEACQLAARAGRAVCLVRRGKYTLVRDSLQTLPVAMYTPRNIRKGSLSIEYTMPSEDNPDAIRIVYNSGASWSQKTIVAQLGPDDNVYVYRENQPTTSGTVVPGTTASDLSLASPLAFPAGMSSPVKVSDVQLPGVIGEKQAMREAAYMLASGYFRNQTVSFSTDLEGLIPSYGSLIGVSHDVPNWGQSAEVVEYDAAAKKMILSHPLTWSNAATHYVRISNTTGEVSDSIVVTRGVSDNEIVLATTPTFDVIYNDAYTESTKVVFGDSVEVLQYVRVKGIKPRSNQIDIVGVVEDTRVHSADAPWLPNGTTVQDPLTDGTNPSLSYTPTANLTSMPSTFVINVVQTAPATEVVDAYSNMIYPTLAFRMDGTVGVEILNRSPANGFWNYYPVNFGNNGPQITFTLPNNGGSGMRNNITVNTENVIAYDQENVPYFVDNSAAFLNGWVSGHNISAQDLDAYEIRITPTYFSNGIGSTLQGELDVNGNPLTYLGPITEYPFMTGGSSGYFVQFTADHEFGMTPSPLASINDGAHILNSHNKVLKFNVTVQLKDNPAVYQSTLFTLKYQYIQGD